MWPVGKCPNAQFWSLQISKDTDWRAGIFLDLADNPVRFGNAIVVTMAHIQAEYVGADFVQRADGVVISRSWAQRCNDFDIAIAFHIPRLRGSFVAWLVTPDVMFINLCYR